MTKHIRQILHVPAIDRSTIEDEWEYHDSLTELMLDDADYYETLRRAEEDEQRHRMTESDIAMLRQAGLL